MISIRIGATAILKAEPLGIRQGDCETYKDLMMGIEIADNLTLAAMMDENDLNFIHEAREVWLDVTGGEAPRRLQLVIAEDDDDTAIMMIDEMNSSFDIHDVTLSNLLSLPS